MDNIIDFTKKLKANKSGDMIDDYSTYLLSYNDDAGVFQNTVLSINTTKGNTIGDGIKAFEQMHPTYKIQGMICCDEVLKENFLKPGPKDE